MNMKIEIFKFNPNFPDFKKENKKYAKTSERHGHVDSVSINVEML